MRVQCPDGHWFTSPGPCPYQDCGYVPVEPPGAVRRAGFAAARAALAEAKKRNEGDTDAD